MKSKKYMKIYTGKTKDVYSIQNDHGHIVIHFKDFALYKNGILDSGGNESKKTFKNKGKCCLFITDYFFRFFGKTGIKTHYVKKLSARKMLVLKAKSIPIEFILRNYAFGTYIERFPKIKKYANLNGLIEFTLKSDKRCDPFISQKEVLEYVRKKELSEIKRVMKKINSVVKNVLKKNGNRIKLVDFKVEFGRLGRKLVVIDDFSTDTARFSIAGKLLTAPELIGSIKL
ncbi:MAG TPA: phosphoribosylaminoimidazolesuccinocarboxamide synthase [Elusimicrobia bacterium]|nr:phosphoribosylaminoimidazolesuccinocarboxamide synthase [Elusimicrobiota bacterium]